MKTLFLAGIFIVLFSSAALASPYLICDCQDNVDQYVITFDNGTPIISDAVTAECTNGQKRLSLDVGPLNLTDGPHHLDGIARSSIWGDSSPAPFDFTKAVPNSLSGLKLSPNP